MRLRIVGVGKVFLYKAARRAGPRQAEGALGERWTYPGTATAAVHTPEVWAAGLPTAGGNDSRPLRTTLSHRLMSARGHDLWTTGLLRAAGPPARLPTG